MQEAIADAMANGGPWLLPLAFLGGLCTSLNPCAYPMMGAVAAYVWRYGERCRRKSLTVSLTFLCGLASVYTLLGIVGGFVGPLLGLSRSVWAYLIGGVCIAAGLFMADILPIELPGFSLLSRYWQRLRGLPGAFVLGVLLGLVATPCATPPLAVIISVAALQQAVAMAGLLLFVYALGHGLPAIGVGLLASSLHSLERLAPYGKALQVGGGWLMIAVGLYVVLRA